jgi:hypothetical protein
LQIISLFFPTKLKKKIKLMLQLVDMNPQVESFEEENRIVLADAGNFLTACFNNKRRGSIMTGFFSPRLGSGNPSLNSISKI